MNRMAITVLSGITAFLIGVVVSTAPAVAASTPAQPCGTQLPLKFWVTDAIVAPPGSSLPKVAVPPTAKLVAQDLNTSGVFCRGKQSFRFLVSNEGGSSLSVQSFVIGGSPKALDALDLHTISVKTPGVLDSLPRTCSRTVGAVTCQLERSLASEIIPGRFLGVQFGAKFGQKQSSALRYKVRFFGTEQHVAQAAHNFKVA